MAFAKKGRRTSVKNKVLYRVVGETVRPPSTRLQNWSSTENNSNNAYKLNFNNGNTNNNNKSNNNYVRAVRALWQFDLFHQPIPLSDFFAAYFECRKKKRKTVNSLRFENDYESKLIRLCDRVNAGYYTPGRAIAFIVDKPVKREIFAAEFADRIIHHLIINKLNPLFEKIFIYDSYACRAGRGTHFAIKRLDHFIRSCSHNYKEDCYILKLDIEGFFMHIDKNLLWSRLKAFIDDRYDGLDRIVLSDVVQKTVLSDPSKNCMIKSPADAWSGLPLTKSLFTAPAGCGLPIGNLTSQVFANFYMNPFDHYVKHDLGMRYYGRYVDDFVIVHHDKEHLKSLVPQLREFLKADLGLTLHPRKIYLQHFSKGVKYLGVVVKPYRKYISNRTLGNMYNMVSTYNKMSPPFSRKLKRDFLSSMNSYLGIMSHYDTYYKRKKLVYSKLSSRWLNRISVKNHVKKIKMQM